MGRTDNDGTTLAELLHAYELRTGLTDAEVGDLVGVHQTQISRWRRGVGVPRESQIGAIADLLDMSEQEVEEARVVSERVREELAARRTTDPKAELRRVRAELRAAQAKVKRLEEKLRRRR